MAMPSTFPTATATGSYGNTAKAPQSKADDIIINHSFHKKNGDSNTSSGTSAPRVIFDFRCHSTSATSSSRNGNDHGRPGKNRSDPNQSTKARRNVSHKHSNRLHHVKWAMEPPLPSYPSTSASSSNDQNNHSHKREHDKNETLCTAYTSPKKQRTSSTTSLQSSPSSSPSSSMPPQRPRKSHGALYHLLLFIIVSFPIVLSSCIHLGFCATVDKNLVLSHHTTVQESACHVSYIAITHVLHHLPKNAQSFILLMHRRFIGSFVDRTINESDNWKRKLFQRVTADHAKKHHDVRSHDTSSSSSSASEEIDRMHPIRHILEGASVYTHVRKQKQIVKWEEKKKKKVQQQHQHHLDGEEMMIVDWNKWKYAMSDDYELSAEEIVLVQTLAERVRTLANNIVRCTTEADEFPIDCNPEEDGMRRHKKMISSLSEGSNMPYRPFDERVGSVAWGGGGGGGNNNDSDMLWWPKQNNNVKSSSSTHSEGGRLLAGYLKIMKWPSNLHVKFPFRLCANGCDSEVAVLHTLEWREKYKPWCVSEQTIRFNREGFIYARGHSRPGSRQRSSLDAASTKQTISLQSAAGHSMVWFRPGLASPTDNPHQYGRSVIHAVEMAISNSLERNAGTIGRFNVVVDCANMSSKNSPSMAGVKTVFSILQDHFPDRLGVMLLANLSGLTQLLMKMVLPFVTEDVRAKIHIIPNDEVERREMLLQFIDENHIPYYLGGKDGYEFDAEGYYQGRCILPEEDIHEYLTTMPYHA